MGMHAGLWNHHGRLWRNRGKAGAIGAVWAAVLLWFALGFGGIGESPAEAARLKNGVKPGDRTRMHIVRRPAPGARKRIFAPGERAARPAGRPGREAHRWFWELHAPAGAAAWDGMLATFEGRHARGQVLTRRETLEAVIAAYGGPIAAAAARARVSPALMAAVISVESAGQPGAVSPKGAQGLMQLIPATARRFGVARPFDPAENIAGGAAYLDWLLREFGGDVMRALAGYNAGEGAVAKHGGVPPYRETRDYVVKVMDAVAVARTLCATPPAGPRDACVWK